MFCCLDAGGTGNNAENKAKRKTFAEKIRAHTTAGDFIVYLDKTNYSLNCKRARGRAKIDKSAIAKTVVRTRSSAQSSVSAA